MHRFIQRLGAAIRLRQPKAGRWQHTQRTRQHRRHVRQHIAKKVVGDNDVKLLGPTAQLHSASVGIHMGQLNVRIFFVVNFLHHIAPQNARFHNVGLLHRADLVVALAGQFER